MLKHVIERDPTKCVGTEVDLSALQKVQYQDWNANNSRKYITQERRK